MNEEDVRQKMLDIVGDIYHADSADYINNGFDNFDGHTWYEAKDTINKAFDGIEPDHPKVKLPRKVGEDLEDWLAIDNVDDILNDLVCGYEDDHQVVRDWWDSTLGATYLIADMARYDWEAESEAKWYVKAPKEWCPEFTFWMCKDGSKVYPTLQEYMDYPAFNQQFQFTRTELKKYHLDSDIFTLVSVEDEK